MRKEGETGNNGRREEEGKRGGRKQLGEGRCRVIGKV